MRALILSLIAAAFVVFTAAGQTPMPIVVPAMTPANTTQSSVTAAATTTSTQTTLKALQALKLANDEILKQQAATLEKLDEIEKAANELRIYSKRG
jgi:hypothetical protein